MTEDYADLLPVSEDEEDIDIHDPKFKALTAKPRKRSIPVELLRTIAECEHFRLDTDTSLQYIASKYKSISKTTFYRVRAYLKSQEHVQEWLNQKARVGFALAHKTQIERLERIIATLDYMFLEESSKPTMVPRISPEDGKPMTDEDGNHQLVKNTNKDRNLIIRISEQIAKIQIEIDHLYNGNVIVAQIQAAIGESRQREMRQLGIVSERSDKKRDA